MLLLLELVEDEVLEGLGECGSSELAVTDFLALISDRLVVFTTPGHLYLDVARHVVLDGLESGGAQDVCNAG